LCDSPWEHLRIVLLLSILIECWSSLKFLLFPIAFSL
jgi:hypothetical protein